MREFRQKHGRNGERYWMIGFEAPPGEPIETITSAWGAIVDGKHKEHGRTSDRPGPKGKEGTKAFRSAQENACEVSDRQIRKKVEEGYSEVGLDGRPLIGGSASVIQHDQPLPKNLCFSKPKNSVSEAFVNKLDDAGKLLFTRKVNGMMVIAHITDEGAVELYTRRMDSLTKHFPHLVNALGPDGMALPPESILLFEAYLGAGNSKRDLLEVQSVMRSLPDRALELQEKEGFMQFYLFRIPIWKGAELEATNTNEDQAFLIENTFTDRFVDWRDPAVEGQFIHPIEIFEGTVPEALAQAEMHGYEGWVAYKRDAKLGAYSYSFHGKPDRPSSCFKIKPYYEDDFVGFWDPENATDKTRPLGEYGTGKNKSRIGSISLYQYSTDQQLHYICEVGSGLSDAQREELTKRRGAPIILEVRYDDRSYTTEGDDTNALFLPRVVRVRDDKDASECVHDKLPTAVAT